MTRENTLLKLIDDVASLTSQRVQALGRSAAYARLRGDDRKAKEFLNEAASVINEGHSALTGESNPQQSTTNTPQT